MIFLYISLVVSLLAFILFWLNAIKAAHLFKTRYPDLKIPRSHWSDRVLTLIKLAVTLMIPICNFAMVAVCLAHSDDLCEKSVARMYKRCMEE